MRCLWICLVLAACGPANDAEHEPPEKGEDYEIGEVQHERYLACVLQQASRFGAIGTLSVEQAGQVAAECRSLLKAAAAERVANFTNRPMTNLPADMETDEGRTRVAMTGIEHEAKMRISSAVLPRPVP